MYILSVMGRKGGTGKSTMAKNIAAGAAISGLRTLLVDADSQHNAWDGLGIQQPVFDGLTALIRDDAEWSDVMVSVPARFTGSDCPDFWVLPTSDGQVAIESEPDTPSRMYARFSELRGHIDLIVVDTAPGISQIHTGLYYVSNSLLLPVLCDIDSALSPEKTLSYLEEARRKGEFAGYAPAGILGVIPNALDAAELVQRTNAGFIQGRYYERYPVFNPLTKRTVWRQAGQLRCSIYALAGDGVYAERRASAIAIREFQPILDAVLKAAAKAGVA